MVAVREVAPGREEAREEGAVGREEEARAVARSVERAAAVLEAAEARDREVQEVVRGPPGEVRDRTDAAAAAAGI